MDYQKLRLPNGIEGQVGMKRVVCDCQVLRIHNQQVKSQIIDCLGLYFQLGDFVGRKSEIERAYIPSFVRNVRLFVV